MADPDPGRASDPGLTEGRPGRLSPTPSSQERHERGQQRPFPIGSALTISDLQGEPYAALARLRATEPVSWVPALDAWLVTAGSLLSR